MSIGKTNIGGGGKKLELSVTPNDVKLGKLFTRDMKTVESGTLNLNNLKPENIKAGINIGGVGGNLSPLNGGRGLIDTQSSEYGETYTLPDDIKTIIVFLSSGKRQYYDSALIRVFRVTRRSIKYNLSGSDSHPWIEVNGQKYYAPFDDSITYGHPHSLVVYGWNS